MTVASSGAPWRARWVELRSRSIVKNAVSLFGATIVTSFLGFLFWGVAARVYDAADIGRVAAAISAMQLLAGIGVLGLGTLIIGEVSRVRDPAALVATGSAVAAVVTGVLALGTAGIAPLVGLHLGALSQWPYGPPVFAVGAALTGLTVVLDQACIGLLRGGLQFWRNAVFATAKLVLLPAGLLLGSHGAIPIYLVWAGGNALSLGSLFVHARRLRLRPRLRLRVSALAGLRNAALSHHWLNLTGAAPTLLLPVVVVGTLGAKANAAFYAALLLAGFVSVIPLHLSTSLFALARGDVAGLRRETRFSLTVCWAVSSAAVLGLLVVGHPLLRLLGPDYTRGATTLVLFVVATIPGAVKAHYIAVKRVHDRLGQAGVLVTLGGLLEVSGAFVGGRTGHLDAVGIYYVGAVTLQGVIMWSPVARAAGLWPFRGLPVSGGAAPVPPQSGLDEDTDLFRVGHTPVTAEVVLDAPTERQRPSESADASAPTRSE